MTSADRRDLASSMPHPDAFADGFLPCQATRFDGKLFYSDDDTLIEEVPVSLEIDGKVSIVMMATPTDLEDFALGFLLTEGIIDHVNQIIELDAIPTACGVGVFIRLQEGLYARVEARKRDRVVSGSCSLCGIADMREALHVPTATPSKQKFKPKAIEKAFRELPAHQTIGAQTGSAHAAAFTDTEGNILAIAEDAGRHNALDKLVGKLARLKIDASTGFCALTSRASVEMVQKAARAGFPMLCAISAPTGMAVRVAVRSGITLCAFARGNRFVCFAHPERINAALCALR